MDNQSAFFEKHPPRCIAAYEAVPTELPGVVFDGHGEELNPAFALLCQCGHNRFTVLGHYVTNGGYLVYVSPLALRCELCQKTADLFDTRLHGHDALIGAIETNIRREGNFDEYKCEECGPVSMEVFTRFEYPDDLFDDDMPECRGREQEFFTWFSLHGRCSGCSRLLNITEFECA